MSKLSKFNKSVYSTHLFTLFIAFFALMMSFLFVWTHDDYWTVGMYSFERAWEYSFFYGNGRYLGNFFVNLIMCRFLLDDIVRMVLIVIVIVSSAILADSYRKRSLLISSLVYMGVGVNLFGNVYVWGHGFYNFVPPVALMLLSLCLLKQFYNKDSVSAIYSAILSIILFVTGVSQQLFSENSTTIILLISLITMISVAIKKRPIIPALAYFVSSLIGTGIMFILPEIMGVSEKMDGYRGMSGISERIRVFIENTLISTNSISCMCMISILISLSLIILMWKKRYMFNKVFFVFSHVVLILQPVVSLLRFLFKINTDGADILSIGGAGTLLLYFPIVIYLLFKLTDKNKRVFYLGTLLLTVASVLQLLVVKPIGSRCFFITCSLLGLITISLFSEVMNALSYKAQKGIISLLLVIGLGFYVTIFSVYGEACYVNNVRLKYADEQFAQGKSEIEIIKLPHERWFHYPNKSYAYSYRYDIDESGEILGEKTFVYIDYEEYLAKSVTVE